MTKYIINMGFTHTRDFNFLPFLSIWYEPNTFLETGVSSPSVTIKFGWILFCVYIHVQEGY